MTVQLVFVIVKLGKTDQEKWTSAPLDVWKLTEGTKFHKQMHGSKWMWA